MHKDCRAQSDMFVWSPISALTFAAGGKFKEVIRRQCRGPRVGDLAGQQPRGLHRKVKGQVRGDGGTVEVGENQNGGTTSQW